MRTIFTSLLVTVVATGIAATNTIPALPDSYRLQFENEWVRIVRVSYAPHAKLPAHAHNALPAAYVYLADGGPVLFKHVGTSYGAATRPATKAGAFRVFRGINEIHEVENTSPLRSEFLRVEFKTEAQDLAALKGRYYRDNIPPGQNVERVEFENGQIRITRVICVPGRSIQLATGASEPSLLIALEAATVRDSGGSSVAFNVGQEKWLPVAGSWGFENVATTASEFLRFDFKTAPIPSSVER